jgi:predicted AlkP superfamily pyrophosphatase or phosphodiesterase
MQPINPTVTWPNHTAIVTGVNAAEHQVLFNGILTRKAEGVPPVVEPWRDKEEMVHAPTIYDSAYRAGLTTAQVDWVAIYNAKTINWQFPELPNPDGAIEKELIADGIVTADQLRTYEEGSEAWQDEIWTDAAVKILEQHRPNLLLFHLLMLDNANHAYGPMSQASYTAMALLDSHVKRILGTIANTAEASKATVIVVSDHGFRSFKHKIHPNVLLREKRLIKGPEPLKADAWVVPNGGTAMVYVTRAEGKNERVSTLREIFKKAEGVERVYGPEEFPKLGVPDPSTSDQGPDLVLAASPDYLFSNGIEGEYLTNEVGGTHGYLNSDPKMQAIFIAWGAGIPRGIQLKGISNLDVAPTIAALLGVTMDKAKGHAIQPIVESDKARAYRSLPTIH